jgi:hypothetical protein
MGLHSNYIVTLLSIFLFQCYEMLRRRWWSLSVIPFPYSFPFLFRQGYITLLYIFIKSFCLVVDLKLKEIRFLSTKPSCVLLPSGNWMLCSILCCIHLNFLLVVGGVYTFHNSRMSPSRYPWFDYPNFIWWRAIMQLVKRVVAAYDCLWTNDQMLIGNTV